MSRIELVCWDVDKVWYPDISTSYCLNRRQGSPEASMRAYMQEGLFTQADVERWQGELGQGADPFATYTAAGRMLTDFLYKMRKPDSADPVLSKQDTIRTKQGLLRGMTLREVREIAADVQNQYTDGLTDAFRNFRRDLTQAAFSDGLGPFVLYHSRWNGMDHVDVTTTSVQYPPVRGEGEGAECLLRNQNDLRLLLPDCTLTGKTEPVEKQKKFFEYARAKHMNMANTAAIDDSGANVEKMLVPIRNAGGIAVGFSPTAEHREIFHKYGIPILKGKDLRAFAELVRNPQKIADLCE